MKTLSKSTFVFFLVLFVLVGCLSTVTPTPLPLHPTSTSLHPTQLPESSPTSQPSRLRVMNSGKMTVENFSILFPEDEIQFGDIHPDMTTEYQNVPKGVFGYAAYRFEIDGQVILQPVMDWVGEVPLDGEIFTYIINFNSNRSQWEMVKLLEIIIDR